MAWFPLSNDSTKPVFDVQMGHHFHIYVSEGDRGNETFQVVFSQPAFERGAAILAHMHEVKAPASSISAIRHLTAMFIERNV